MLIKFFLFFFRYAEAKRLGEQVNSSRQKISKYFSVYFSAQTCKGSSYNYPPLDFVTNQKKRLLIVCGKMFLHGYDLISYDFTLKTFFISDSIKSQIEQHRVRRSMQGTVY